MFGDKDAWTLILCLLLIEKWPLGCFSHGQNHIFEAFCLLAVPSTQRLMAKIQILDKHSNAKCVEYQIMKLLVRMHASVM